MVSLITTTIKIANDWENVTQIILYPFKWTINSLTNCDFFKFIYLFCTKSSGNSYDIEIEQQVRNQGTNCMLAIISAMETNKNIHLIKRLG